METLYIPDGPGDPHNEREDELLHEMMVDLAISRGMLTATLAGSPLYNFHRARVIYLEQLLTPVAKPVDKDH